MKLIRWLELGYINPNIPLKTPGSKHQRKIREIYNAIEQTKNTGDLEPILSINHIGCRGENEIVAYCRYLQHIIEVLKERMK